MFVLFSKPVPAQNFTPGPDLRFDNYNERNGFVSNFILRMMRAHDGYLWVSGNGLYRFDGKQYQHFDQLTDTATGFRGNRTPWVVEDRNYRIWVVGSRGLCYYDKARNKFNYQDVDARTKVHHSSGACLDGSDLWFVCNKGLCKINTETLKVDTTALNIHFTATVICKVSDSILWVCDWSWKHYIYNIRRNTYTEHVLGKDDDEHRIWDMIRYKGRSWISASSGVWVADGDTATPQMIEGTENIGTGSLRFAPKLTGDSVLWVGTGGQGLKLLNVNTGKVMYSFLPDQKNPYSIPGYYVNSVYVDSESIVWLSTENGISSFNYYNQDFKTRLLPEHILIRIVQDSSHKNVVWMTGYQQGVLKIDWRDKKILQHHSYFKSFGTLSSEGCTVLNMFQTGRDTWLLSSFAGIYTWNSRTGENKRISSVYGVPFIGYTKDSVFISTTDSLYVCNIRTDKVRAVCKGGVLREGQYDGHKYLWLASGEGLVRYDVRGWQKKTFKVDSTISNGRGNYMRKAVIYNGNEVICCTQSGVAIFNIATEKFVFHNMLGALKYPGCYDVRIIEDIAFISTNGGLVSMDLATGKTLSITLKDKNNFSEEATDMLNIARVNDELVMGHTYGYTYFKPSYFLQQPLPSAPMIEKISINNTVFNIANADTALALNYNEDKITFYFTAFEYKEPTDIQFRYKIDGLDRTWVHTSSLRQVEYAHIPPGSYTFLVQAGNEKGMWNDTITRLSFTIRPPYWQTAWFRLLLVFGFVSMVTGIAFIRIRTIKKREAEKTRVRVAISEMELKALRSQMNPHFIFNSLNSIQKFIWENNQEDAAEYLTKFSRLIRMILDNSMHRTIVLETEISTLMLYLELEHRRCNNKFDYYMNVDSSIQVTEMAVPPLVLQPYAENAIWHGLLNKEGRGTLMISVSKTGDDTVQCVIEDNGIGRAAAAKLKEGRERRADSYGMQLTKQRLEMMNENGRTGAVLIEDLFDTDNRPAGTRVIITFPIANFVKM